MYIFLTAGHPMYAGAKGILDETVVDRAVSLELASILRSMGHTVKYYNSENIKDYVVETSMANQENFDWYIDIHCNASNGQGHGTETLVYTDNKPQAHKISANISKLGFITIKQLSLYGTANNTSTPCSKFIKKLYCFFK